MAEILLTKVVNNEIELEPFLEWLITFHSPSPNKEIAATKCSQPDFITYFLNFVHEDIPNTFEKWSETKPAPPQPETAELTTGADLNDSYDPKICSTPKTPHVTSLNASYLSPVSPLYRNDHSFTTPTSRRLEKSPICLSDFIVKPRNSKKKSRGFDENSHVRRRINPTNLAARNGNGFRKSENSFDFNKSSSFDEICPGNADEQRNLLAEERRKISFSDSGRKLKSLVLDTSRLEAQLFSVHNQSQLDRIVEIYVKILVRNFVLNVSSEIRFLVSLLLKKQSCVGTEQLDVSGEIAPALLFTSIHNVVYFAAKSLQSQIDVVKLYDKSTIKLLAENDRLGRFVPGFVARLKEISQTKIDRYVEISPTQDNICFISDTDNRLNFPNDPSFHAFKKQRDLFYEILRIWENGHLGSGWDFSISLRGKIRSLLSLSDEPLNYVHFARLFKAQLLSTCRHYQVASSDFISSLPIDAEKLSRLKSRLVTKQSNNGSNCLPNFSGRQEFYRDFILTASNHVFNRHLCDSFICEIVELNENNFSCPEYDDQEIVVDVATKKAYYACVKSLRLLAKFLGFVESLPYKTECNHYSENLIAVHVKAREQVQPNFDVRSLLETAIFRRSAILCVPWLTKYLAMLDYATLRLPYYTLVSKILFEMYRNFDSPHASNVYLVKFCLGWLFELPHYPDMDYSNYYVETGSSRESANNTVSLDLTEIVDQNILYFCCPHLDEIKKLLVSNSTSNGVTIKHITPVTAIESPDEVARKKLEQQLEEAFFSGQPVSTRKTIEFVSERVASTCVKYIVATLVPNYKKVALERVRQLSSGEIAEDDLVVYKSKVNQLAAASLVELRKRCEEETVEICGKNVGNAIESLVALDVLPTTKEVCAGIAKKTCVDRVKQWIGTHVTLNVFVKDFDDEIKTVTKLCQKKEKKLTFALPPEGTRTDHNDETTSAAHLLENIQDLCVKAMDPTVQIDAAAFVDLLDDISRSLKRRGDINDRIAVAICTLLVDLSLVLLCHNYKLLNEDNVLTKLVDIWESNRHRCGDLFKSLLCTRNVMIFAQSVDVPTTWTNFAKFCAKLIKRDLLSCDSFASQCTGIFQHEWDQNSLKHITGFYREFVKLYREGGGCAEDFTFLLNFLSDYCEDL